jgi:hypothetical protein
MLHSLLQFNQVESGLYSPRCYSICFQRCSNIWWFKTDDYVERAAMLWLKLHWNDVVHMVKGERNLSYVTVKSQFAQGRIKIMQRSLNIVLLSISKTECFSSSYMYCDIYFWLPHTLAMALKEAKRKSFNWRCFVVPAVKVWNWNYGVTKWSEFLRSTEIMEWQNEANFYVQLKLRSDKMKRIFTFNWNSGGTEWSEFLRSTEIVEWQNEANFYVELKFWSDKMKRIFTLNWNYGVTKWSEFLRWTEIMEWQNEANFYVELKFWSDKMKRIFTLNWNFFFFVIILFLRCDFRVCLNGSYCSDIFFIGLHCVLESFGVFGSSLEKSWYISVSIAVL